MNAYKQEFAEDNFEILAFPCNSFHYLEPGANAAEILNALTWVRPGGGFMPNFQMFKKIDVNGKNELPLFTYLKSRCGPVADDFASAGDLFYDPLKVSDIRWNYEIFVIGRTGMPVYRYDGKYDLKMIGDDIRKLANPGKMSNEIPELKEEIDNRTPIV